LTVIDHKVFCSERKKENTHTIGACDLSELVETWPMRVSFLHQASGLFIASKYRSDNYKRELKKGEMKSIQCSQSKNSFPMKVSDWSWHAMIRFPKFRS
jgi:hypothetical protein